MYGTLLKGDLIIFFLNGGTVTLFTTWICGASDLGLEYVIVPFAI